EAGPFRLDDVPVQGVGQQVAGDVDVLELLGERAATVDNAAAGYVAPLKALVRHVLEVTVGVWVLQFAVLAEVLDVKGPLDLVQHDGAVVVRTGDDVAMLVEVQPPGVAAALRK